MKKRTSPKGLFDILPYGAKESWQTSHLWHEIEDVIRTITQQYNFQEIRTPIFEYADTFCVGIGSTSDIVSKEMYLFSDKKERSLALRPEGTSSILRAFFERNLTHLAKVHKLFYIAPMFRYEKPQKGRYRQHHQFGVEVLGSPSYEQDAEVIDLLFSFYQKLGIKGLCVELNSVGDAHSRELYKKALFSYLSPKKASLSKDSQRRMEENILRILDSKDLGDREILQNAPSILDYLSPECKEHFSGVESTLRALNIPYKVHPHIVRGLDYYNQTVFEITASDLGAQNAIGAGGRYDGFAKMFSGQDIPGIGFGTGLERVVQTMVAQNCPFREKNAPFVFFAPMNPSCRKLLIPMAKALRLKNIPVDIDLKSYKIQELLRRADQIGASFAVILGENEEKEKVIRCKQMSSRKETVLPLTNILSYLEQAWEERS
ncbi:MAG: histidine--tRNA ligase [Chlamydiota bacterium]